MVKSKQARNSAAGLFYAVNTYELTPHNTYEQAAQEAINNSARSPFSSSYLIMTAVGEVVATFTVERRKT